MQIDKGKKMGASAEEGKNPLTREGKHPTRGSSDREIPPVGCKNMASRRFSRIASAKNGKLDTSLVSHQNGRVLAENLSTPEQVNTWVNSNREYLRQAFGYSKVEQGDEGSSPSKREQGSGVGRKIVLIGAKGKVLINGKNEGSRARGLASSGSSHTSKVVAQVGKVEIVGKTGYLDRETAKGRIGRGMHTFCWCLGTLLAKTIEQLSQATGACLCQLRRGC